jgi:hypothetical protein
MTKRDPLLYFARKKNQSVNQVFDEIQCRIRTLVGFRLSRMSKQEVDMLVELRGIDPMLAIELLHWQRSNVMMTIADFDNFAPALSLSMVDVMGEPNISDAARAKLQKSLDKSEGGIDPVRAYVFLSALRRIDEIIHKRWCLPHWEYQDMQEIIKGINS